MYVMHVMGDVSRGDYLVLRSGTTFTLFTPPPLSQVWLVKERCQLDEDSITVRSSRSTQEGWYLSQEFYT